MHPGHAGRRGAGIHRPGRQLRPGHAGQPAHPPGVAQLRADRADQHQAQPQPPDHGSRSADPALPRPHRHRPPGLRPAGGHRGRFVQHDPRLPGPAGATVDADAFGTRHRRRYRRRHAGQAPGGLAMAGGGLRTNPRADRGDHPGFRRLRPPPASPWRLLSGQRGRASGMEHRQRPRRVQGTCAAGRPVARAGAPGGHRRRSDPADAALPRPVQHHAVRPGRPLPRRQGDARGGVRQPRRHPAPGP